MPTRGPHALVALTNNHALLNIYPINPIVPKWHNNKQQIQIIGNWL